MKMMTKAIEKAFAKTGSQDGAKDPIVIAKWFNPVGAATWWATEYDPKTKIAFGYVTLYGLGDPCNEWGYFSLAELEEYKGPLGLGIERDLSFTPTPVSKEIPEATLLRA